MGGATVVTQLQCIGRVFGKEAIARGGGAAVTRARSGHLGGELSAVTHNRHLVEASGYG